MKHEPLPEPRNPLNAAFFDAVRQSAEEDCLRQTGRPLVDLPEDEQNERLQRVRSEFHTRLAYAGIV